MSHEVRETRSCSRAAAAVLALAGDVVGQLGGSRPRNAAGDYVTAEFNKRIGDKAFGNRVRIFVRVTAAGPDRCSVNVEAYPVDPIGNRLRFGVLGEPARLVTRTFWEQLEARLTSTASTAADAE
jgi:hypothetical protein